MWFLYGVMNFILVKWKGQSFWSYLQESGCCEVMVTAGPCLMCNNPEGKYWTGKCASQAVACLTDKLKPVQECEEYHNDSIWTDCTDHSVCFLLLWLNFMCQGCIYVLKILKRQYTEAFVLLKKNKKRFNLIHIFKLKQRLALAVWKE